MKKKLPEPKTIGLQTIQQEFDIYQNSAFEKRSPNFFALEICGECGELANMEKKIWRSPEKIIDIENLSLEAADILISLMNYCNSRNIDLEYAVKKKLGIIEERRLAGLMGEVKLSK